MSTGMVTLHEIAVKHARKQKGMVDSLTEEAPILNHVKWKAASHGLWNVAERLTDIEGPAFVAPDAPLPDPQAVDVRRRPFASIFPTLVSMIVSALRTIPVSAAAIDLRGYGRRNSRTRYRRLESGGLRLAIHFLFAFLVPAMLTAVALMTA